MNPLLSKIGSRILVSHSREVSAKDGTACYGDVATVTHVGPQSFVAQCDCGWRFVGMRTDKYRSGSRR